MTLAMMSLLSSITVAEACNLADVCDDTSASFSGMVIVDGLVEVGWSSDDEGSVMGYVLERCYSGSCAWVATVAAAGSCGTSHAYELVDEAPNGFTPDAYRLSVMRVDGLTVCPVETVPQSP